MNLPPASRPTALLVATLALALTQTAAAGQSTYVGKDASRCEIFRALSAQVPADCQPELQEKTPVIHPAAGGSAPAPLASAPASRPRPQASRPATTQPTASRPRAETGNRPHRPPRRPSLVPVPPPREIPSGERAMATPIEFAFDSERLTAGARQQLDNIAAVLQDPLFRGLVIRIEGHTDAVGPDDYNLDLSRRRARTVRDYLIARHAIEPRRLPAEGKGETDPFDARHPEAGINRRVEFVNTGLTL